MGFSQPVAVAVGEEGVLFVGNRGSDRYRGEARIGKLTVDQEFIGEFGRQNFEWLAGLIVGPDGNVYASDEWENTISVFDNEGNELRKIGEAGDGPGQFNGSSGIAFDSQGNLWVVNVQNSRVQKFTTEGKYLGGFGTKGKGPADLDMPWGLAIDKEDNLYIADWNNHRVQKFTVDGKHLLTFGHYGTGSGSLNHPTAVAVDNEGDVYVVDWLNERVVIYDKEAKPLAYLEGDATDVSKWGQLQLQANPDMVKARRRVPDLEDQVRKFRMPMNCAFDRATNKLIVCDTLRNRLQVYEKDLHFMDPQFNL